MRKLLELMRARVESARAEEDGAESLEILIFAAVIVVGLVGTWMLIRNAGADKGEQIADCLNNSDINGAAC